MILGSTPALVSLVMLLSSGGPLPPAPTVGPTIKTAGKLGRRLVRRQVLLRRAAIRRCFEQHLTSADPDVRVTFAIDGTGRVIFCNAGTTPLDQCVSRVVCSIRFPYSFDTLPNGSRRVTRQLTWVRFRMSRLACDRACLAAAAGGGAKAARRVVRLAYRALRRPATQPASRPASRPTSMPQSQPASRPASLPVPLPLPPPARQGGIPRIPLPQSDDPLEGIRLQKNPLDL